MEKIVQFFREIIYTKNSVKLQVFLNFNLLMLKVKSPWPSNTETKPRKQQMDAASRKFHLFVTRVSKSRFGTNLKTPNFANLINEPWNMYFESQTNRTPSVHVSKQWIFKPPKKCNTNTDRDLWQPDYRDRQKLSKIQRFVYPKSEPRT